MFRKWYALYLRFHDMSCQCCCMNAMQFNEMQEIQIQQFAYIFSSAHTTRVREREWVRSEIMTKNWYAHTLQCWRLKSIRKIGISENWKSQVQWEIFFLCICCFFTTSISHKQLFCCCFLASLSLSSRMLSDRPQKRIHNSFFIAQFEIQTLHFSYFFFYYEWMCAHYG